MGWIQTKKLIEATKNCKTASEWYDEANIKTITNLLTYYQTHTLLETCVQFNVKISIIHFLQKKGFGVKSKKVKIDISDMYHIIEVMLENKVTKKEICGIIAKQKNCAESTASKHLQLYLLRNRNPYHVNLSWTKGLCNEMIEHIKEHGIHSCALKYNTTSRNIRKRLKGFKTTYNLVLPPLY